MAKREAEPDPSDQGPIEILPLEGEDVEWEAAYEALRKNSDPAPLAALLKQAAPPDWVAASIGVMLDPPKKYRGPRLKIVPEGKRSREQAALAIRRQREVRARVIEVKGNGKLEAAIEQVMKETKLSRTDVYEAYRMDDRRTYLECAALLGNLSDDGLRELSRKRRAKPRSSEK